MHIIVPRNFTNSNRGVVMRYLQLFIPCICFVIISCSQSPFRQAGYLKDAKKNRIYTVSYSPGTPESEIRAYAAKLMHSQGQLTAAYFYPEGSQIPADGITLAGSILKANEVLYETPGLSNWHFAYMRYFTGNTEFVDCRDTPDHDLCRK